MSDLINRSDVIDIIHRAIGDSYVFLRGELQSNILNKVEELPTAYDAEKVVEQLEELENDCVQRNINGECDRDCAKCDLVRQDADILNGYDIAIKALDKQIPKEPTEDKLGYKCPVCSKYVYGIVSKMNYCANCGQAILWEGEAE